MDDPLDDDGLDVASSIISNDDEEDPTHHTKYNHVPSWTPFIPDPRLPQTTIIPPDKDLEGVPQDDSETADPEGGAEGATLRNKHNPRSVYFEQPPDDFALPTSINQLTLHLNQREQMLHCYCAITIAMGISPFYV